MSKPHLSVATIIRRSSGEYLMVHEFSKSQKRMVINQPAGHVENGETLQEAAIRETLEETGYVVKLSHVVGFYHYHASSGTSYCRACFAAEIVEQVSKTPLDDDIEEALWLTVDELSQYTLRSGLVEKCIQDYRCGAKYPLHLCKGF